MSEPIPRLDSSPDDGPDEGGWGTIDVIAQRTRRATGHLYVFALRLIEIPEVIPVPSVGTRSDGNRLLNLRHARGFATYWTNTPRWAAPPLLLDTPVELDEWFTVQYTRERLEAGVLRLPGPTLSGLQILDGQHRIFGWNDVRESLRVRAVEVADRLARARERGESERLIAGEAQRIRALEGRLRNDYVTVEVLDRTDLEEHKQWFFDIAANAKGITKSLTASFDQRGHINKATMRLVDEYEPLADLVEREADRVGVNSSSLLTVAQLVALVEASVLGTDGWVRREYADASEIEAIMEVATSTLDVLFDGFDDLRDVKEGSLTPAELRRSSLVGSVTFLRALVGLVHELAVSVQRGVYRVDATAIDHVVDFCQSISGSMSGPVPDFLWESGSFASREVRSPTARRQAIKALRDALLGQARVHAFERPGSSEVMHSAATMPTTLFDLPLETR